MNKDMNTKAIAAIGCLVLSASTASAIPDREAAGEPAVTEVRVAQAATAPKQCVPRRGKFYFQFEEAAIFDVLKQISLITCRNFIVSESVKGGKKELTIISRSPVYREQAYSAFLSALEANNMALVPAGRFYKVVERKDAAKQPVPMYEKKGDGSVGRVELGDGISYNDAQVTFIYELKYTSKDQVQPILRNLMSKTGDLQVVGENLLIITESAANIRRLVSIMDRIDVSGAGNRIHIVNIEYAEASGIATKLTDIFGSATVRGGNKKPTGTGEGGDDDSIESVTIDKIVADERTNKLIIIASEKAFQHIQELIDVLDVPGETTTTGAQVYVHPLNNADAQKTASTLSSLAQGSGRNAAAKKGAAKNAPKEAASLFEDEVKITADEATNSLVIIASARDYRSLKKVIEDLDVRRPQVFVEAAILEVALTETRSLAVDAYSGLPVTIPGLEGSGLGFIANEGGRSLATSSVNLVAAQALFQNLNANNLDPTTLGAAADAVTGIEDLLGWVAFHGPPIPGSQDIFGFAVPSFGVVLNALQNNANVDVLSTPHIMTTDNEKAEISVGKKVPVVRGISNFGGGGGLGGFGGLQQVQYEDVKLKFSVTPHVNDSDEIRLEVEQEVSDLGEQVPVGNGLTQPVITQRNAKTVIVVKDQQTMVIGGLIQTRKGESESKFPLLGDLPVIGWLFKRWNADEAKTNLIIVLTPYVVRSRGDFGKIYDRKMKERQEFIEAYYGVAQEYNPYVDYDKKSGPLARLVGELDHELQKLENGGPGVDGQIAVTPETAVEPFAEDGDAAGDPPPPGVRPITPGDGDTTGAGDEASDDDGGGGIKPTGRPAADGDDDGTGDDDGSAADADGDGGDDASADNGAAEGDTP